MVSSFAIAAVAEGYEPEDRARVVDEIAAKSQSVGRPVDAYNKSSREHGGGNRRIRAAVAPQSPRGPPDDDLEERLRDQLHFSIDELAKLSDRSAATIFRYLRLGLLPCIRVGGYRRFTRAVALDFLRYGTRDAV
jgi:hypothetical protein